MISFSTIQERRARYTCSSSSARASTAGSDESRTALDSELRRDSCRVGNGIIKHDSLLENALQKYRLTSFDERIDEEVEAEPKKIENESDTNEAEGRPGLPPSSQLSGIGSYAAHFSCTGGIGIG